MNYKRIHDAIIEKRKLLGKPLIYSEKHHIIPKSFGGSNEKENIICLTAREHFIIHRLLAKIYPDTGMVHAVFKMSCMDKHWGTYKVKSRTYAYLREQHALTVKNDKGASKKKSEALLGRKQTKEHALKRAKSRKNNGPWLKEETKTKIGDANRGKDGFWKGKTLPEELVKKRNNTRFANGNYCQTYETRQKISASLKGIKGSPKTEEQKSKQRKKYLVNGEIVVENAKKYCLENNIRYQKFISAANNGGKYKNLIITKLEK
jgi:hypothetical protein